MLRCAMLIPYRENQAHIVAGSLPGVSGSGDTAGHQRILGNLRASAASVTNHRNPKRHFEAFTSRARPHAPEIVLRSGTISIQCQAICDSGIAFIPAAMAAVGGHVLNIAAHTLWQRREAVAAESWMPGGSRMCACGSGPHAGRGP